jgi:hypothetical protein
MRLTYIHPITRARDAMPPDGAPKKPNYNVKKVEAIAIGTDVQARLFTLAPADVIPWHHHSESTDHYFVLRGALTIETRHPDDRRMNDPQPEGHRGKPHRTTKILSHARRRGCVAARGTGAAVGDAGGRISHRLATTCRWWPHSVRA